MKWWPQDINRGDIIRIKLNSIYHYGIYVSSDEVIQFGLPPIINTLDQKDIEVISTDINTFSCNKEIEVLILDKKEKRKAYSKEEVVLRAQARLGERGYNIIHNNCEHFVYECLFGYKYSSQEEEMRNKWANMPYLKIFAFLNVNKTSNVIENVSFDKVFKKSKINKEQAYRCFSKIINDNLFIDIRNITFKNDKKFFLNDNKKIFINYQILDWDNYLIIVISNGEFEITFNKKESKNNNYYNNYKQYEIDDKLAKSLFVYGDNLSFASFNIEKSEER
ncbi:MAG: lecithin retinol acyltransferase family protein [Bacilli bacterium]|nr:lecithin retinol acyltransferase family protein [Bacilli bacterium]